MNQIQKTINSPEIFYWLDDKFVFYDRCITAGLPVPPMLAVLGVDCEGKYDEINSGEGLKHLLDEWQARQLILRRMRVSYRFGLFSVTCDEEYITDLATGERHTPTGSFELVRAVDQPYLVQRKLSLSKELHDIMSGGALGTVRIMTYRYRDERIGVPYARLKLPVSGALTDNFKHGTSGNLLCGIDVESGTLMTAYGVSDGCVSISGHATHPETGGAIEGRTLSFSDDVVELCKHAATCFPEFHTIGWDVAVTDETLYILEGNRTYDPDILQVVLR